MKRKSFLVVIAVLLIAVFALVACNKDDSNASSTPKQSTKASVTPSINMTAAYASARDKFYAISGYWLPELEGVNIANTTSLPDEQHTEAVVDLTGTSDLSVFVSVLQHQINIQPTATSEESTRWDYSCDIDGKTYICSMVASVNEGAIRISYSAKAVSASYMTARAQFKNGTGILLPLMADLEVGEHSYDDSSKEFTFDIIGGTGMSDDTFMILKNFFDNLSGWTADQTLEDHAGVYDKYYYFTANDEDMVQLVWQREYNGYGDTIGVYVTANMH